MILCMFLFTIKESISCLIIIQLHLCIFNISVISAHSLCWALTLMLLSVLRMALSKAWMSSLSLTVIFSRLRLSCLRSSWTCNTQWCDAHYVDTQPAAQLLIQYVTLALKSCITSADQRWRHFQQALDSGHSVQLIQRRRVKWRHVCSSLSEKLRNCM